VAIQKGLIPNWVPLKASERILLTVWHFYVSKTGFDIGIGYIYVNGYVREDEQRERGTIEAGFPGHVKVLDENVWSMCVEVANSRLLTKGRSIEE
jgi:hypothetical protein